MFWSALTATWLVVFFLHLEDKINYAKLQLLTESDTWPCKVKVSNSWHYEAIEYKE